MTTVGGSAPPDPDRAEENALREYYENTDFLFSAEGILKVISVVACIAVAAFHLGSGEAGCGAAPPLPAAAAVAALVAAGSAALLYAGTALQLPLCAPQLWLFMDLIISAVLGVLLLVMAILSLVFCETANAMGFLKAVSHTADGLGGGRHGGGQRGRDVRGGVSPLGRPTAPRGPRGPRAPRAPGPRRLEDSGLRLGPSSFAH
ncbi:uncharacterized protein LOC128677572 isoform X1 [Plodia interpunctella]|uniref:uncharacterized protein LOC128677572 isoform X1 n=1 Tax=Plodia interpunctella TaxID=58824 RepID=UPI0023685441|nr:uncharacterized protein LOC128677572 isoform X1 [Plodia interpunctella]